VGNVSLIRPQKINCFYKFPDHSSIIDDEDEKRKKNFPKFWG
jgi:hypothetical protein